MRANLKSITHRCYIFGVAFVWELTKETIHLPLGCLHRGLTFERRVVAHRVFRKVRRASAVQLSASSGLVDYEPFATPGIHV